MKAPQSVIAVSAPSKTFISDESASHLAPNKGGDMQAASHRELVDAMVEFIESNRYEQHVDDSGELVEIDKFTETVQQVLTRRIDTVRVRENTLGKKLERANQELEEMRAMLAALQTQSTQSLV